jgi:hypothetical protein
MSRDRVQLAVALAAMLVLLTQCEGDVADSLMASPDPVDIGGGLLFHQGQVTDVWSAPAPATHASRGHR